MKLDWYFNDENSPSDELVDKFADSKFGMDRWTSFTREIIQNSLDARNDNNKPVKVVFDLNKGLTINDIPGGKYTKEVLEKCAEKSTNKQTKQAYKKGIEILSKPYIYCLKVSDYNTKGVRTGRDEAWGALVFDEGRSVKNRPGSAGSHGVGKKVPFIISTCNTVFYATKNKYCSDEIELSDRLVQGKTQLINWDDSEGRRKAAKGWFGKINEEAVSPKERILPIQNEEIKDINPYFVRNDEFGTDVIMLGVNAYDNELQIKKAIITSILENFFVAIKEGILVVDVFGETFKTGELNKLKKWYKPAETVKNSINDLLQIYSTECDVLPIEIAGETIGEVQIYFDNDSELNHKYYTVVREHGMKIREYRINRTDTAFTGLAIIKGKKLNELLSSLENAAHDDFIVHDEDMDLDKNAIKALSIVKDAIEQYIIERTKIDDGQDQSIDSLSEILAIPGFAPKITKKDVKVRVRKSKVKKRKKIERTTPPVPTPPAPAPDPNPDKEQKKRKQKIEREYNSFAFGPVLVKNSEGYMLRVMVKHDMKDCEFRISSINSDDKIDNSISDLIVSAQDGWKKYKVQDGCIQKVKLKKDELYEIQIKTNREIRYRLAVELWYKEA